MGEGGVFGSRGCGLEGAATSLLRHARAEPSGARRRPGYPGLIRNNSRTEARARDGASEVYASKLQLLDSGALHRQLKHGSTSKRFVICVSMAFHKARMRSICFTAGEPYSVRATEKNPTRREFRNAWYSARLRVIRRSPDMTTHRPSALRAGIQSASLAPAPNLSRMWTTSCSPTNRASMLSPEQGKGSRRRRPSRSLKSRLWFESALRPEHQRRLHRKALQPSRWSPLPPQLRPALL